MLFGLIVKRTDIRVFPTDEPSMSSPDRYEFDRFQHSSISPGSPVGIYHFSKDKGWAYVQTCFIRGWVRSRDLAIAKERKEVIDYEEAKERLVSQEILSTSSVTHLFNNQSFLPRWGTPFPCSAFPI